MTIQLGSGPGLQDKRVVVTGAGSGIGRESAILFARTGSRVAVVDRDQASAEVTVEIIREQGGQAIAVAADVADTASVTAMGEAVAAALGGVDLAHLNASTMVPGGDLLDISIEQWDHTFAVNCRGAFLTARECLRLMVKNPDGGALCFTGSDTALRTSAAYPAYLSSKHAVIGIARSIAVDFGSRGIRSNIVTPGVTDTPGLRSLYSTDGRDPNAVIKQQSGLSPLGRIASVRDVAEAAVFLCSDRAAFITGANLVVDGGMTVRYDAE